MDIKEVKKLVNEAEEAVSNIRDRIKVDINFSSSVGDQWLEDDSKVRGESRARFLQELNNETVTVWPPSRQTQVAQQTQGVLPTDLKWEFSSLSWLAPRLDSNPCPHPQRWLWGGYKRWHLSGLVKVVPAETSRGQRHREKTRLWLGATGDSQTPAPPPETVPAVGAPCVYIWESILEVGIWNRGNQSRLELASTALLPTPEPGNQSDTKQGASAPPSPECLFHPHQGLQGGTPEWSPGSPLSPFKCTRQPTWTSDQILNGVQIMQQRRLFYWGGGRKGSIWSCCISRLWSLVKKLMSVWRVSSE